MVVLGQHLGNLILSLFGCLVLVLLHLLQEEEEEEEEDLRGVSGRWRGWLGGG